MMGTDCGTILGWYWKCVAAKAAAVAATPLIAAAAVALGIVVVTVADVVVGAAYGLQRLPGYSRRRRSRRHVSAHWVWYCGIAALYIICGASEPFAAAAALAAAVTPGTTVAPGTPHATFGGITRYPAAVKDTKQKNEHLEELLVLATSEYLRTPPACWALVV